MKLSDFNKRSKGEQFFLLLLLFCASFAVLALSGCSGNSCEKPSCGHVCEGGAKGVGCSVPGCGGCLSCGKCDTGIFPSSVKCISACYEDEEYADYDDTKMKTFTCDSRFRGGSSKGCGGCGGCGDCGSCFGCGSCSGDQNGYGEKACYWGCASLKTTLPETDNRKIVFCGSTNSKERIFGCVNGCIGCGEDEDFDLFLSDLRIEEELGVD